MAINVKSKARRSRRFLAVAKPSGTLHPRVQKAGPEHFGIVAVDCAKARSKWMLADFYGRILIPPTEVEHHKPGFDSAIAQIRQAITQHDLRDLLVAIERTGIYHLPVKRAFASRRFETRIVHPLTTRQYRLPADPGNKTDDTDLFAIHRATTNGFGLVEPPLDETHGSLRLLARHRRDLVRKNATLRNQIHALLDVLLPGYSRCFGDIFLGEAPLLIARSVTSAAEIRSLGTEGLARILVQKSVRFQGRTLDKILAWACDVEDKAEHAATYKSIINSLDDERRARLAQIARVEREMAGFLVRTPYVVLLSMPGIGIVTAAEFAGEMGPIANYANDQAITGRAGIYPSRYQSDRVDRCDGPLVRRSNRTLRRVIMLIAENLLMCNRFFQTLQQRWQAAGTTDRRAMCVRAAKRFCRIGYQMVAGKQVFRHPSCQTRDAILRKLSHFYVEHETPMAQVMSDLQAATDHIPKSEHATEAKSLFDAMQPSSSRQRSGPRRLGEILPAVLAKLGVTAVELSSKGENDLT
jgi:transposase